MSPPETEGPPSIPNDWIAEFEGRKEAQRLEQLYVDRTLVDDLRWEAFAGKKWRKLSEILVGYGYQVLRAWVHTDTIFEKVALKGFGRYYGGSPRVAISHSEVDDVVVPTLQEAIEHFKTDVLMPGIWDPEKGATLKTFFIGQCLMRFPGAYRTWYRERREWFRQRGGAVEAFFSDEHNVEVLYHNDALTSSRAPYSDPLAKLVQKNNLEEAMATVRDRQMLLILALRADGFEYVEIAEILDISVPAIKSKVHHYMTRVRRDGVA